MLLRSSTLRRTTLFLSLVSGLALATAPAFAQQSGFILMPDPAGDTRGTIFDVSNDGNALVGLGASDVYLWTRTGGYTVLPRLDFRDSPLVSGLSGDGRTVFGEYYNGASRGLIHLPFLWTAAGGYRFISLPSAVRGRATGTSFDGSIAVGYSDDASHLYVHAFRWTEATGAVALAEPAGALQTQAEGISEDGQTIIGTALEATRRRAILWLGSGSPQTIDPLAGDNDSAGVGLSGDGAVAIGTSSNATSVRGFRWTSSDGAIGLASLAGHTGNTPMDISTDGRVIVGWSGTGATLDASSRAVRWDATGQVQSIEAWLASSGIVVPSGTVLMVANGVSADGNVVGGETVDHHAWLARAGSGFIGDTATFNAGLLSSNLSVRDGAADATQLQMADFDAMGERTDDGERAHRGCLWTNGRVATMRRDDTTIRSIALGGCLQWRRTTLTMGLGDVDIRQDLASGGRADLDGQALSLGVSTRFGAHAELSLQAYRGDYDARVDRRYLNGDALDTSSGRTDATADGARVRFAWHDAVRIGGFAISPQLAYAETQVDVYGYAESGGGFDARFDRSRSRVRDARLGAIASRDFGADRSVSLGLEGVRIERDGDVEGEVDGLYGFGLDTGRRRDDGLRAHVAYEQRIAPNAAFRIEAEAGDSDALARYAVSMRYRIGF